MPPIGFSTGALFKSDVARGVSASRALGLDAIELSALRLSELAPLDTFSRTADLSAFTYVSVHAPTDYSKEQEVEVAQTLESLADRRDWNVVVHPDCFVNTTLWRSFGRLLCIENMDKRKGVGRTVEELNPLFEMFPDATLCFDLAHAYQVDPSMTESYRILREFGTRIGQIHLSEVTSSSKHSRISEAALESFLEIASLLPRNVPVILESPVSIDEAASEVAKAVRLFAPIATLRHIAHA